VIRTIDDLDVEDRRVLVRLDLNVPLDGTRVEDDARIRAALPTLNALTSRQARVVVCAHLGRPGGKADYKFSLAPVAVRLGELLGHSVQFAGDTVGPAAHAVIATLPPGHVAMVENLRFDARETSKDDAERGSFADELAALADVYVSDGFGVVHRKHASVYDVALRLPHAAGYLIQAEVTALRQLTEEIRRPYVVVLGGAKVSDKIGALDGLIRMADLVLIGGAMANPFLAAQGCAVGRSLLNPVDVAVAAECMSVARRTPVPVELPTDVVVAAGSVIPETCRTVDVGDIPRDMMALDIGPETSKSFASWIGTAQTVFWNGPMGVFEVPEFAEGTVAIIEALTASPAFTVVGGGDTAASVHALGFADRQFGYVSTGGGASLEFVEGKVLPGLAVLEGPERST
jgi:phosphoglycerate kinase